MRGKVYRTGTTEQVASYLLRVRKNALDERLATWRITLTDGRQIVWDAATHYEQDDNGNALSFAYTAGILRSDSRVLTDFEPFYYYGYGGKLKLFFLE